MQDSSHLKLDACAADRSQLVTLSYLSNPLFLLGWDLSHMSKIVLMRFSAWSVTAGQMFCLYYRNLKLEYISPISRLCLDSGLFSDFGIIQNISKTWN